MADHDGDDLEELRDEISEDEDPNAPPGDPAEEESEDEEWTLRDLPGSILFAVLGAAILAIGIGMFKNGYPMYFWGNAFWLGPVLLLLGLIWVVRSIFRV